MYTKYHRNKYSALFLFALGYYNPKPYIKQNLTKVVKLSTQKLGNTRIKTVHITFNSATL